MFMNRSKHHLDRRTAITVQTTLLFIWALSVGLLTGRSACAADNSSSTVDDPLLQKVDEAIEVSTRRYLTAGVHTPWQIMHGLLALRGEFEVKDKSGNKLNAADWISQGVYFNGEPWFQKTRYGARAHPYTSDYIFEGHANQFLAIMASAGFSLDHKLKAGKAAVTVRDLVNNSKKETNARDEITWTLWALAHYLEPDATWTNKYGQTWSIERLVAVQNQQQLSRSACGGTHGLFALAYARNQYLKTKRPLRGVWLQADQRIKRYIQEARAYQNSDGSFSSNYFQGYGHSRDFEERLSTSGHILEFLMMALPDKDLQKPWVRKAVNAVATDLIDNKHKPAEPGALYHALDGLILYRTRITAKAPRAASAPKTPAPQTASPQTTTPTPKKKGPTTNGPVAARRPSHQGKAGDDVAEKPSRFTQPPLPIPPKP